MLFLATSFSSFSPNHFTLQLLGRDLSESYDAEERSGIMSRVFVEMERALRDLVYFYIAFLWYDQLKELESDIEEKMKELTDRQVKMKALDIFLLKKRPHVFRTDSLYLNESCPPAPIHSFFLVLILNCLFFLRVPKGLRQNYRIISFVFSYVMPGSRKFLTKFSFTPGLDCW
jgi:hypothetical protein